MSSLLLAEMHALTSDQIHKDRLITPGTLKPNSAPPEFLTEFRQYGQAIVDRLLNAIENLPPLYRNSLLGPDYNREDFRFEFLLVDDDSPNAWIMDTQTPPIMGIHTGMLQSQKANSWALDRSLVTEDQFASVLCHELLHFLAKRKFGDDRVVHKPEETFNLMVPLMVLQDAGYNPKSYREALTIISPYSDVSVKTLRSYSDAHLQIRVQKDVLEMVEHQLEKSLDDGETINPNTSSPIVETGAARLEMGWFGFSNFAEFKNAVSTARYCSELERILYDRGYHGPDGDGLIAVSEKAEILEEVFTERFKLYSLTERNQLEWKMLVDIVVDLAKGVDDEPAVQSLIRNVTNVLWRENEGHAYFTHTMADRGRMNDYDVQKSREKVQNVSAELYVQLSEGLYGRSKKLVRPLGDLKVVYDRIQSFASYDGSQEPEHIAQLIEDAKFVLDFNTECGKNSRSLYFGNPGLFERSIFHSLVDFRAFNAPTEMEARSCFQRLISAGATAQTLDQYAESHGLLPPWNPHVLLLQNPSFRESHPREARGIREMLERLGVRDPRLDVLRQMDEYTIPRPPFFGDARPLPASTNKLLVHHTGRILGAQQAAHSKQKDLLANHTREEAIAIINQETAEQQIVSSIVLANAQFDAVLRKTFSTGVSSPGWLDESTMGPMPNTTVFRHHILPNPTIANSSYPAAQACVDVFNDLLRDAPMAAIKRMQPLYEQETLSLEFSRERDKLSEYAIHKYNLSSSVSETDYPHIKAHIKAFCIAMQDADLRALAAPYITPERIEALQASYLNGTGAETIGPFFEDLRSVESAVHSAYARQAAISINRFFTGFRLSGAGGLGSDGSRVRATKLMTVWDEQSIPLLLPNNAPEKVIDGVPYGIPMEHPFIRFMMDDPNGIFSGPAEKIPFLSHARYLLPEPTPAEPPFYRLAFDPRAFFGYALPSTYDELMQAIKAVDAVYERVLYKNTGINTKEQCLNIHTAMFEIQEFLRQPDLTLTQQQIFELLNKLSYHSSPELYESSAEILKTHVSRHMDALLAADIPLPQLIDTYRRYQDSGILNHMPEQRRAFQQALVEKLETLQTSASPQETAAIAEMLLLKGDYKKTAKMSDPTVQNRLVTCWVDAQQAIHGIDDKHDAAYRTNVKKLIDRVVEGASSGVGYAMLDRLSVSLLMQEELSMFTFDALARRVGMENIAISGLMTAGEISLDVAATDREFEVGLTKFLRTPFNRTDTTFLRLCESRDKVRQALFEEKDGEVSLVSEIKMPITTAMKQDSLEQVHDAFWQAPLEARAAYMRLALFPSATVKGQAEWDKIGRIMDTVMPQTVAYGTHVRHIFDIYLHQLPPVDRQLLVCGILMAGKDTGQSMDMQELGHSIKQVMESRGVAGRKMLQAFQNLLQKELPEHPELAPMIEGTRGAKTNTSPPKRWDMWKRAREVLPTEFFEAIDFMGELLGAGSAKWATRIIINGEEKTFKTTRRGDINFANREFGYMEATAAVLAKEEQQNPAYTATHDLVQETRIATSREFDPELRRLQAQIASASYDNFGLTVEGARIYFHSEYFNLKTGEFEFTGQGPWEICEVMKGQHFEDLPATTPEEIAIKRIAAKAILASELHLLLSGEPIDEDRHAGQQRIRWFKGEDGTLNMVIGNLDPGGTVEHIPTPDQLRAVGRTLAGTLARMSRHGEEFGVALINEVEARKGEPGAEYLQAVKTAFLKLDDYMSARTRPIEGGIGKPILNSGDLVEILSSVYRTGDVSRHVKYAAVRELAHQAVEEIRESHGPLGLLNLNRYRDAATNLLQAFRHVANDETTQRPTPEPTEDRGVHLHDGRGSYTAKVTQPVQAETRIERLRESLEKLRETALDRISDAIEHRFLPQLSGQQERAVGGRV